MSKEVSVASVIRNRGFLNLWANQILVQLSYNALNFALIIWVFRLTGSNTANAALLFSIYLPAVIFGLFSGVLVDILDRRRIMQMINILLAISFFSLIFLKFNYAAILFIAFFINALGQFYSPAEASAIPLIVRKNQLLTANSMFSTTLYSCFLLGFGLAGPLINHLGIDFVFGFGGLLLLLGFFLSLRFPSIKAAPDADGKKLLDAWQRKDLRLIKEVGGSEIRETIRLIRGKLPVFTSILILSGIQVIIGILAVLMPSFLEKTLQINAADASYVLIIPLGLGIVSGGLVLSRLGYRFVRRRLVGRAIIFSGILLFLVGASPFISPAINHFARPTPLPFFYQPPLSKVLIVGSFLMGIAMVSILVPSQTVLQENTPKEDRGKVFSVLGVAMSGLSLVPVLLSGILADLFGTAPIFIGLGIIIVLIGSFTLRPSLFLREKQVPQNVKEFLGMGHWEK
ncbi:MAG: MFS transporter [Patescibacteria group bacterium]|nr:MFS transporter [Patescibacteria group bacterium]